MSDIRSEFLADHKAEEAYYVDPATVFDIAASLIQLLLTFLPADKAKRLIDAESIRRANAVADAAAKAAGLTP